MRAGGANAVRDVLDELAAGVECDPIVVSPAEGDLVVRQIAGQRRADLASHTRTS
ncbi:MAG TPA: hypothetical protein VK869_08360 [Rubrobacteraceae bacterium]|nr:hypothetical protein [Rubrobacteraceae bacterium]